MKKLEKSAYLCITIYLYILSQNLPRVTRLLLDISFVQRNKLNLKFLSNIQKISIYYKLLLLDICSKNTFYLFALKKVFYVLRKVFYILKKVFYILKKSVL